MDAKLLADAVTIFLAPALPFLVSGGEEAVRRAGKKIGEDGLEIAKKLWEKLRPKVEENPRAQEAAAEAAAQPDDPDVQAALRLQIRKILEADAALAAELDRLVETARRGSSYQATVTGSGAIAQGRGAVSAGAGGVAVGGDVHGDFRVGGERGPAQEE
jgi:hypothetical protein